MPCGAVDNMADKAKPVKDLSLTLQSRPWFMRKCCPSLSLLTEIAVHQ